VSHSTAGETSESHSTAVATLVSVTGHLPDGTVPDDHDVVMG
jgi:hypothetical protein